MTPAYRLIAGSEDITERIRRYLDELRVTSSSDRESDTLELTVSDEVDQMIGIPGEAHELPRVPRLRRQAHADGDLLPGRCRHRARAAQARRAGHGRGPAKPVHPEGATHARVGGGDTGRARRAAIAAEHGYVQRAWTRSLAESPIAHIDQVAESDLHPPRRVVGHYDATLKAAAGHLVVARRGSARTAGTGVPLPITTVMAPPGGVSTSIRGRVKVRGRARYGSVRASYYNSETAAVEYVQSGDEEPTYVIREPRPDAAQAAADAEAKLLELHRRTGTLELSLPGNPALLAESPLQMSGWGTTVDGPWIVGRATHVVTGNSGYTTEIAADTAPPAAP